MHSAKRRNIDADALAVADIVRAACWSFESLETFSNLSHVIVRFACVTRMVLYNIVFDAAEGTFYRNLFSSPFLRYRCM